MNTKLLSGWVGGVKKKLYFFSGGVQIPEAMRASAVSLNQIPRQFAQPLFMSVCHASIFSESDEGTPPSAMLMASNTSMLSPMVVDYK